MVIGECPNCSGIIHNAMPDVSPAYANPTCEHCGKKYWIKLSRIESEAYTEGAFEKLYKVDREKGIVELRVS